MIAPKPFEFKRDFFRAEFLGGAPAGVGGELEAPPGRTCSHKLWKTM
ncbi:hypothetical protein HAV22_14810 [Massilia sp. TW-1]|uniref:Uncharacterized protein n=1 Tax=Telluria antibiotica TaxID=2717319 RepID=A0ABX0PC35_9BURK|nr:hypothetical protein [Telluria antibiotica]NIA54906.1 hypothetical protein [Telluria antibiotica]